MKGKGQIFYSGLVFAENIWFWILLARLHYLSIEFHSDNGRRIIKGPSRGLIEDPTVLQALFSIHPKGEAAMG